MQDSPLDAHVATPNELKARIEAERRGMPFLVYRDGDGAQSIVELEPDRRRLTLGRRETNDVALAWDAEVSRLHATLEHLGDEWAIADDGLSHNGTFVNGDRVIGERRLDDGDVIRIGATALAFRQPGTGSRSRPTATAVGASASLVLSPAQRRVLVALCRPLKDTPYAAAASNQQIADELVVTVDAVKATLRALFDVFGVAELPQNQKRAALVTRALQSGAVTRRDL